MMGQDEGVSRSGAAVIALGVVAAAALTRRHASPTPDHPKTRRWYRELEKPGFTPPATAYGIMWTVIQAALAYGGHRLLRHSASPERTLALSIWGLNQAAIDGFCGLCGTNSA